MKKKFSVTMLLAMLCIILLAVTVPASEAHAAKLNKKSISLNMKSTYTLKLSPASKAKWSSSKKSVATVNSKGKVTAKKKGTAYISAKVGKKTYKCKVKVFSAKLSKTKLSLNSGKSSTLKITGAKASKWKSSNTAVATVSSKGKVTARKAGSCKITAYVGNSTLTCKVTVKGKTAAATPAPSCPSTTTPTPSKPTTTPVPTQAPAKPTATPTPVPATPTPTPAENPNIKIVDGVKFDVSGFPATLNVDQTVTDELYQAGRLWWGKENDVLDLLYGRKNTLSIIPSVEIDAADLQFTVSGNKIDYQKDVSHGKYGCEAGIFDNCLLNCVVPDFANAAARITGGKALSELDGKVYYGVVIKPLANPGHSFTVSAYYKNQLLATTQVVVTGKNANEAGLRADVDTIMKECWDDSRTAAQNFDAIDNYIAQHYTYNEFQCFQGSVIVSYIANLKGYPTRYYTTTSQYYSYDPFTMAWSNTGGEHRTCDVMIDGVWSTPSRNYSWGSAGNLSESINWPCNWFY